MDFQTILVNNSIEITGLLRRHKIAGPLSIDTIKRAHDQKGDHFMMELLKIITPTSNFTTELMQPKMAAITQPSLVLPKTTSTPTITGTTGWDWWNKLLTSITNTGTAIEQVKNDVSGPTAADTALLAAQAQQEASTSNMLYFVAAGFVMFIIIILIFRK